MSITFPKAREIFLQALKLPEGERGQYLEDACGDDFALHQRLKQLLHAHQEAGSLPCSTADPIARPTEKPGTLIGPYKLLEAIGEGGFGVVFMAEQQNPVRRKVALKIIKPGMDTRQVVARFEAERQALAMMDHPSIARVFDGGEADSGRPYFVMELVRGALITDFCDENRLSVRARLELFVSACQAVQHAHQKGVIHRDLKPSNIMVTLHDGIPVVKVIDFGIAKAMGPQLTDKTLFTNFSQMIGTPLYMSPEQAEMSGLDVDTRTDIYSLGVLLYELLTGTTPFEKERLQKASYDEIRRIIREDEPPRPSTRLSTLGLATTALSANKQSEPQGPRQVFRGELDWVVMKALEKDRNRRYESASALAAEVQRYLHDEPVQACPPTMWHKVRRITRRNKVEITTAALVCGALMFGTAISAWQAVRARQAERQARASLAAEQQSRQDAESNLLKARQVVDQYLTLTSESRLLDVPGLQPLRKDLLEAALAYYEDFLKQRPRDPQIQADLAAAYIRASQIYTANNSNGQAMAAMERGLNLIKTLRREYPQQRDWPLRLAGTYNAGRDLHYGSEGPAEVKAALEGLQTAIQLWEQFAAENPGVAGFRSDLAGFHDLRADLELASGRRDTALSEYHRAQGLWQTLTREHPAAPEFRAALSRSLDGIGKVLERLKKPQEAEKAFRDSLALREALATEFPEQSDYRTEVAYAELRLARLLPAERAEEAAAKLQLAQDLLVKVVAELPYVPSVRENLGISYYDHARLLRRMGRPDEAIQACRESLMIYERLQADFPALHQYRERWASYGRDLAFMLLDAERPTEAESHYAQAAQVMEELVADAPHQTTYGRRLAGIYIGQGDLLLSTGRHNEAAAAYRRAIELRQIVLAESPDVPIHVRELSRLLAACPNRELRDSRRAMELANQAIHLAPEESSSWYTLGVAHYSTGNWSAALEALERSSAKSAGGEGGVDLFLRTLACGRLSQARDLADEQRKRYQAEAQAWHARAVEWMEKNKPVSEDPRRLAAEAAELMEELENNKN